jgi:hypothetical protein
MGFIGEIGTNYLILGSSKVITQAKLYFNNFVQLSQFEQNSGISA